MLAKVLIEESVYLWIKKNKRKARLGTIINKINDFVINGEKASTREQKLFAGQRIYKTRFNDGQRLIYSVKGRLEQQNVVVRLLQIGDHDSGDSAYKNREQLVNQPLSWEFMEHWDSNTDLSDPPAGVVLSRCYAWHQEDDGLRLEQNSSADLWWLLDEAQDELKGKSGPIILRGTAGSGKTTIALYRLMEWYVPHNLPSLYITYSEKLKSHAEKSFKELVRQDKQVLFKTIDQLCLALIPEDKKEFFQPDQHVNFVQFETFLANRQCRISAHMLWEEFRGILKGCFYLATTEQKVLDFKQYQNLNLIKLAQTDSLFAEREREQVYKLFENYQRWLKDEKKWDDMDLARCAFQYVEQHTQHYAQVIVDEVQDLTTYHLQIILALTTQPETLFLTGDAHQSIHPSRFQWERLKDQVYGYLQLKKKAQLVYRNVPNSVQHIKKNYRCSKEIIHLINALASWRSEHFGDDSEQLEAVESESKAICAMTLSDIVNKSLLNTQKMAANIMILVPDEAQKQLLINKENGLLRHCTSNVFNIHESKGLETTSVILYGFFEKYGSDFQRVGHVYKKDQAGLQHRLRYLVNLFNVACSRAKSELILLDSQLPDWQPLTVIQQRDNHIAQDFLKNILSRESTYDEYEEQAIKLEENHNWQQAAGTWEKINRLKDAHRCLAKFHTEKQEWLSAAQHYQHAELFAEAYTYYEKAESYQDALIVLLQMPTSQDTHSKINDFFDNPKKIAKIRGNFGQKILEKIIEENSSVAPSILFRYSKEKAGLARESIRKTQRDINHNLFSSRAAEARNQQFVAAMQAFNNLINEV